jgi:hypothetical protein
MSIFDRLRGAKKTPPFAQPSEQPAVPAERPRPQSLTQTCQPSQPSAGQRDTQAPQAPFGPLDTDLVQRLAEGMRKIRELELDLGNYYKARPIPANEMFVEVRLNLNAHELALLNLLRLPHSGFNDVEIKNQITRLEGAGEVRGIGPSPLISLLNEILGRPQLTSTPEGRAQAAELFSGGLRAALNMYFEIGSKLLVNGDLETKDLPADLIARAKENFQREKANRLVKQLDDDLDHIWSLLGTL